MGLHQTEELLHSERKNHRMKRQSSFAILWNARKYLQTTYPIKGYYPKYTSNSAAKKPPNNPTLKSAEKVNRHFSKEDI